ncbi:4Fe-4S binding protein [Oceanobacillus massiliensis]|uniref:4Fe-4S binding protein n=1 Tax=Oceanobacillus massiliensis TaxID=1465765 RepID=UPI00028A24C0|nr:4Fe-4S binding protein [Oceanobacillus massiliensis]
MSQIFKQKEVLINPKLFSPNSPPKKMIYNENGPAKILLDNNTIISGSCLHCPDTPCMKYKEEELINDTFMSFPQDNVSNVCPTEAITLDADSGAPTIDPNRCIACGICASRCPSGAIYFKTFGEKEQPQEVFAVINNDSSESFEICTQQDTSKTIEHIEENKILLESLPKEGLFIKEEDRIFDVIYSKMMSLKVDAQFPNLLTRNLLIQTGTSCAIRRKGDVNLRMDGVLGPPGTEAGVLEVELASMGILDSPRNMLDNIAVLNSRYNIKSKTLTPLIVSMSLANSRTEYYRVIRDIKNILNIKINTLTIGALFILIWNNKTFDFSNTSFYLDSENLSLRNMLEDIIGRKVLISEAFLSILETSK